MCDSQSKPRAADYDGSYVENHCTECAEFESECICDSTEEESAAMCNNDHTGASIRNERDALAAHVESAAIIMHRLAESPAHFDGEAPPSVRAYLDWYLEKPETSLAKRDARVAAKAFKAGFKASGEGFNGEYPADATSEKGFFDELTDYLEEIAAGGAS